MAKFDDRKWRRDLLNEEVKSDITLPADKQIVLKADTDEHQRGLVVCWKSTGGYHVAYWYGTPDKIVPAEVRAAEELPEDDKWKDHGDSLGNHKNVWIGYHPSLDENKLNERPTNLWKHFDAKMKLQDEIMDLEYDMKMINRDLSQLHRDMEQEAEPSGGPKATRYGREIEKKEKEYKKKKAQFKKLMAKLDRMEQY